MTEEELQAIRERATKATPGPWEYRFRSNGPAVETQDGNKHIAFYALQMDADNVDVNGDFIAHAREDIPALLAEVERLRVALEREHEDRTRAYEYANADAEIAAKRIRELMRENAAMREIVRRVAHDGEYGNCLCIFSNGCEPVWSDTLSDYEHAPECPVTKARAILADK